MNSQNMLRKRWVALLKYGAAGKLNVRYAMFALCHTLALASFASIAGAQAPAQITEGLQPQDGIVVHIRNGKSKYHLTQDYNGNRDDRRNVSVWPLANNDGFRWLLYKTGDGYYYISNVASGLVLTQDGKGDNRNVSNWGRIPGWKRQHWQFVPGPDNFYHIVNRETGQGLDQAYQGNRDDKRNVTTWPGQTFRDKGWSWRLEGGGSPKLVKLFIEKIKAIIPQGNSEVYRSHEFKVMMEVMDAARKHAVQAGGSAGAAGPGAVIWPMIREVAKDAAFQKTIQQLAAKGGKFIETDQVWSYIEETFNCQNCQFGTHVGDDLNILVNGVSIWPDGGRSHRTTKARQTHDVHTEYLFNRAKGLKIGLVEYDSVSGDDSLGSNYQAPNLLDQPRRFERLFIKHTPSRSLYEITYRIEPLNYGPATGSGSPQGAQAGIAPQPPIQARVQPQFTIAMVLGEYRYNPFQNNWHIGWIEQDGAGLRWRNKAGAKWRLTPDLANKRLLTGTDNPYYAQGRREFKLIMSNGQVTAFQFGGETYSKP